MSQRLWIVLGLRFVLFLAELGVGIWSRSLALLAGSGHLFSDLLTLGLTLLAAYVTKREAKKGKSVKELRLESWLALVNGVSLVAIALLLIYETIDHLQHHSSELSLGLPVSLVAALGVVINGITTYLLHRDQNHSLNVRGIFLHQVADMAGATSILLSALVIYLFHWAWADAITSLFVAFLIVVNALSLCRDSFRVLAR
ncbi:MAG: cation diffusion facilitator family transporter [Leptolyngbyaceae cyanobacterium bins.302]|nr:cation diffusion facilitator family transporter [Leptolyngbyaceae cyanobacterium bins.302]